MVGTSGGVHRGRLDVGGGGQDLDLEVFEIRDIDGGEEAHEPGPGCSCEEGIVEAELVGGDDVIVLVGAANRDVCREADLRIDTFDGFGGGPDIAIGTEGEGAEEVGIDVGHAGLGSGDELGGELLGTERFAAGVEHFGTTEAEEGELELLDGAREAVEVERVIEGAIDLDLATGDAAEAGVTLKKTVFLGLGAVAVRTISKALLKAKVASDGEPLTSEMGIPFSRS